MSESHPTRQRLECTWCGDVHFNRYRSKDRSTRMAFIAKHYRIVKFCLSVLVFKVTSSTDAFRPVRSRQRGYGGTAQMTRYAAQALQSRGLPKNIKYFCKEIFFAHQGTRGKSPTEKGRDQRRERTRGGRKCAWGCLAVTASRVAQRRPGETTRARSAKVRMTEVTRGQASSQKVQPVWRNLAFKARQSKEHG